MIDREARRPHLSPDRRRHGRPAKRAPRTPPTCSASRPLAKRPCPPTQRHLPDLRLNLATVEWRERLKRRLYMQPACASVHRLGKNRRLVNACQRRNAMSPIALLLNVLWLLFGGLAAASPGRRQPSSWPHHHRHSVGGRGVLHRRVHAVAVRLQGGVDDERFSRRHGTGPLGVLGNIVWFVFAGWWLALAHRSLPSCSRSPSRNCHSRGRTSSSPASRSGRSAGPSFRRRLTAALSAAATSSLAS